MNIPNIDTLIGFAFVMLLLSLIVTVVVQAIVAVFDLRGKNLLWGIEIVLREIGVEKKDVTKLATRVLKRAGVTPNPKRFANAIDKKEFVTLLGVESVDNSVSPKTEVALADTLIQKKDEWATMTRDEIAELARETLQTVAKRAKDTVAECEKWFDIVMARTTERFAARTRWITIGAAAILALFLHIDTLDILHQMESDPSLRTALVSQAQAMVAEGESQVSQVTGQRALATEAVILVRDSIAPSLGNSGLLSSQIPPNLNTRLEGQNWLAGLTAEAQPELIAAYDSVFTELTRGYLQELRGAFNTLTARLDSTQLDLFAIPSTGYLSSYWQQPSHFGGVVLSVILLSLGAPFWFNTLRNLVNLRPALARRADGPKATDRSNAG